MLLLLLLLLLLMNASRVKLSPLILFFERNYLWRKTRAEENVWNIRPI